VPGFSTELCGGTHVRAAGDIGPFVIVSESAIQAGVRRIEAVTGAEAVRCIQRQKHLLGQAARSLKTATEEVPERIEELQKRLKEAKKQQKASSKADVASAFEGVKQALAEVDGILVGAAPLDLDQGGLREVASRVKSLGENLAVVLVGADGEKVPWIALAQGAALERGFDAKAVASFLRGHLGGGGGGKPELAQGQGQNAAARSAALEGLQADPVAAFGAR